MCWKGEPGVSGPSGDFSYVHGRAALNDIPMEQRKIGMCVWVIFDYSDSREMNTWDGKEWKYVTHTDPPGEPGPLGPHGSNGQRGVY